MTEHLAELVGGSQDGAVMPCEDVVERLHCKETGEIHEWDGEAPVRAGVHLVRRFVFVKPTKEEEQ